ncbi:MAG TPA: hypothetical protein VKE50_09955 [Thermoanaerobaculia bacterium]|nr:hypothetical protein [Thermoanaerobaculia bacterium]
MSERIRRSLAAAGFVAALALGGVQTAQGQVFFQGSFPVPHGHISIGIGAPPFVIGGYVPAPYVGQVVFVPGYGYGFYCDQGFVPVTFYGGRWVVSRRPYHIARYNRFGHSDWRYDRYNRFHRDDSRRWDGDREHR